MTKDEALEILKEKMDNVVGVVSYPLNDKPYFYLDGWFSLDDLKFVAGSFREYFDMIEDDMRFRHDETTF